MPGEKRGVMAWRAPDDTLASPVSNCGPGSRSGEIGKQKEKGAASVRKFPRRPRTLTSSGAGSSRFAATTVKGGAYSRQTSILVAKRRRPPPRRVPLNNRGYQGGAPTAG